MSGSCSPRLRTDRRQIPLKHTKPSPGAPPWPTQLEAGWQGTGRPPEARGGAAGQRQLPQKHPQSGRKAVKQSSPGMPSWQPARGAELDGVSAALRSPLKKSVCTKGSPESKRTAAKSRLGSTERLHSQPTLSAARAEKGRPFFLPVIMIYFCVYSFFTQLSSVNSF